MLAAVMTRFGDADVLVPTDVPTPEPATGWVRVDLRASALNWHDVLVRQGLYGSPLPHVPGADGAGVRADTGEEVIVLPSLWWGERDAAPAAEWEILGDRRWGTAAQSVVVPQECVAPKPSGWGWHESAALPLVGLTVYRALISRGRLSAGESLLVLGAGGGVATMAISMAAAIGAPAWVTSSSDAKIATAQTAGAVGGVRYDDPDWAQAAKALSPGGAGFDVVLDSVGAWSQAVTALRPGGRLVVLGASQGNEQVLQARPFYFGQYELIGTTMGSPRDLAGLLALIDEGRLPPPTIAEVLPLARIADAHRLLESGQAVGKIVLDHT
ncbi:quinone oxidoreductase family protein [Kribbia dieselivorans]|uniref:quinone oxidoreductase family protein n=1 Tax=Kribbia dieselivorans TaxID=331526 RepID=UPI0008385FE7|nr:zinc-binding dehydrogenase [Kribbia dieselivorans]